MSKSMIRLHITPLNPDLLDAILGPGLKTFAESVSYHTIQTAPETSFGYLELPAMDAEKVKKKLNGAILKGKRLKIEDARAPKRTLTEAEDPSPDSEPSTSRRSKRAKSDANVLSGHELSPDRKVKRGWTEPKSDSRSAEKRVKTEKKPKLQAKSKHTDSPELLFRTKVPPNKASEEVKEKRKKRKKEETADVVHEFEKSTKVPSFLRHDANNGPTQAVEYKDGEGWVDVHGEIIEKECSTALEKRKTAEKRLEINIDKAKALQNSRSTDQGPLLRSAGDTEESTDSRVRLAEDETSSSGTSSSSTSSSDSEADSKSDKEATDAVQAGTSTANTDEVHPLKALFKKPRLPDSTASQTTPGPKALPTTSPGGNAKSRPSLELSTSFSFFGAGGADDSDEDNAVERPTPHTNDISHNLPQMPMTPFSIQDFRFRQIRSAAPTPDTADIRKSTGYGSLILGEDDPDDVLSDGEGHDNSTLVANNTTANSSLNSSATLQGLPKSEFERRFWEKRGENNRAWKARRRAVLKEQRQRENRARRPRGF